MPYGTVSEAQTYWTSRGYPGAPTAELLTQASVFVDGLGWRMNRAGVPVSRFSGMPTITTQAEQWPRTGAKDVYGRDLAADAVPQAVLNATYEAAFHESQNAGALNAAVRADERVVREKFGPIEFQYAEPEVSGSGIVTSVPIIPAVMATLAPVLTGGGNAYGISGVVA